MLCKICNNKEANAHASYKGLCSSCRHQKYSYSKEKKCSDCQARIVNEATYCLSCSKKHRQNRVERRCQECGTLYVTKVSERKKFCSKNCSVTNQARRMKLGAENSPAWNGGKETEENGYLFSYDKSKGKRQGVHVQIAERALGRHLKPGEVVHHINMNKQDNRNSNLLICSQSYHLWLHNQMARAWVEKILLKA